MQDQCFGGCGGRGVTSPLRSVGCVNQKIGDKCRCLFFCLYIINFFRWILNKNTTRICILLITTPPKKLIKIIKMSSTQLWNPHHTHQYFSVPALLPRFKSRFDASDKAHRSKCPFIIFFVSIFGIYKSSVSKLTKNTDRFANALSTLQVVQ